jgi:hypothetical protein
MLSASRHSALLDSLPFPPTADPAALSSFHLDTPSSSSVVVSPSGTIHVLGYTPSEGERGVPITVRIHFQPEAADALYVRLVVGHKAVATKVRELPNFSYGRWQLDANIPPNDSHFSSKLLLSVQALNDKNEVLDSVTFGEFSYWSTGLPSAFCQYMLSIYMPRTRPRSSEGAYRRQPSTSQAPSSVLSPGDFQHEAPLWYLPPALQVSYLPDLPDYLQYLFPEQFAVASTHQVAEPDAHQEFYGWRLVGESLCSDPYS